MCFVAGTFVRVTGYVFVAAASVGVMVLVVRTVVMITSGPSSCRELAFESIDGAGKDVNVTSSVIFFPPTICKRYL